MTESNQDPHAMTRMPQINTCPRCGTKYNSAPNEIEGFLVVCRSCLNQPDQPYLVTFNDGTTKMSDCFDLASRFQGSIREEADGTIVYAGETLSFRATPCIGDD